MWGEVSYATIMVKLDNAFAMRSVHAFTGGTFDGFEFHIYSVLPEVFLENYLPCIMVASNALATAGVIPNPGADCIIAPFNPSFVHGPLEGLGGAGAA